MRSVEIAKLPRDPGVAGWYALLPPPEPPEELAGDTAADWVVIGAGFAGLAAARRLRQLRPEARVVVLEARRAGEGPAGRSSGFMIDVPHHIGSGRYAGALEEDRRQIRLHRAAIEFARDTALEYGLGEEVFALCGKHNAAATARGLRHLRAYAQHLDHLEEPYGWLDADAMTRLTGSRYFRAGLFTPGTAMIQPAAFVRDVARGLARAGVEVYEDSPVVRLDVGPPHTVRTAAGSVTAPRVVLGVNGHAESFGLYRRRLLHVFTYSSMTRQLSGGEVRHLGGESEWHLTSADPLGTTVRRLREGRILVRKRFTYDPSLEVDDRRLQAAGREHVAAFRARFPMLADVEMEHCWGGRLCLSRNGVPGFGEVADSVYSAVCQNGLGVAKGTLAGMAAAELATGTDSWRVRDMLAYERPRRLPPEPFLSVGARAYLRAQQFRSRRE